MKNGMRIYEKRNEIKNIDTNMWGIDEMEIFDKNICEKLDEIEKLMKIVEIEV